MKLLDRELEEESGTRDGPSQRQRASAGRRARHVHGDDDIEWTDWKRANDRFKRTEAYRKSDRDKKIVAAEQWKYLKSGDKVGPQRKHIKRNCMTWAYSSRKFGMAKQLQSDHMDPLATEVRLGLLEKHPFQPTTVTRLRS